MRAHRRSFSHSIWIDRYYPPDGGAGAGLWYSATRRLLFVAYDNGIIVALHLDAATRTFDGGQKPRRAVGERECEEEEEKENRSTPETPLGDEMIADLHLSICCLTVCEFTFRLFFCVDSVCTAFPLLPRDLNLGPVARFAEVSFAVSDVAVCSG